MTCTQVSPHIHDQNIPLIFAHGSKLNYSLHGASHKGLSTTIQTTHTILLLVTRCAPPKSCSGCISPNLFVTEPHSLLKISSSLVTTLSPLCHPYPRPTLYMKWALPMTSYHLSFKFSIQITQAITSGSDNASIETRFHLLSSCCFQPS